MGFRSCRSGDDVPLDTNPDSSTKGKFYPEEMAALYEAALAISPVKSYKTVRGEELSEVELWYCEEIEIPDKANQYQSHT